jgi:RNA polymerase sigma factor (sigma-70 family)
MFALIEQLKKNDQEAIALLYTNYGEKMYGYAITKWKVNEDVAWELVYKTLYKVIDSIDSYTFKDENRFIGFVFKVFTNYLRNHLRDSKDKGVVAEELFDTMNIPFSENEQEEGSENESALMKCLKKVLDALEDWQRVLLLMKAQDFSYKDISPYVDKPEKQLKVYNLRLRSTVSKNTNLCLENNEYEG